MCIKNITKDQQGISLIEVIVSLFIASVVIVAVTLLLSIATISYRKNNTETQLQKESQIAVNQIDDLLMESKKYWFFDGLLIDSNPVQILVLQHSLNYGIQYDAIICDKENKKLYFHPISELIDEPGDEQVKAWALSAAEYEIRALTPKLLANYIHDIQIVPTSSDINADAHVNIILKLCLDSVNYQVSSDVAIRNQ